ncbi:hypothetical protein FDUTEX481_07446 [Tolypothrix sp. PCC 7601]|nr:hypothetical protein FDUTEX481_07446 [Tolypothrix sp. PCC 7601]
MFLNTIFKVLSFISCSTFNLHILGRQDAHPHKKYTISDYVNQMWFSLPI